MSDTVIRVENLSKKYVLGHQQAANSYKTFSGAMSNAAKSLATAFNYHAKKDLDSKCEDFWALKDVSFEIKQGDKVGIIGRNGAGKSTLLKVLSRITEPTTGSIQIKGRVASLLEVGTGFHPELTGRENIFLNGAILGMSKVEIQRKFDEIVAFAEIEKFLDTPVKRYSSGMYVRLAFAVAAHLEPEILIVDEVLAVGDVQFQKKCLGKMEDVGREGRTILFVSHNMGTVQQLCNKSILLEQGKVKDVGSVNEMIDKYLQSTSTGLQKNFIRKGNKKILFDDFFITDEYGNIKNDFLMGDTICVNFSLIFKEQVKSPIISVEIKNSLNESFAHLLNIDNNFHVKYEINQKVKMKIDIPKIYFTPSIYFFSLWVEEGHGVACDYLIDCMSVEIIQGDRLGRLTSYPSHVKVFLDSQWQQVPN